MTPEQIQREIVRSAIRALAHRGARSVPPGVAVVILVVVFIVAAILGAR